MKSKYPNQIDSSEELPIVRDNITEVGSEILNSLRSAVLQLQKTLGINPQGAVGQTLSQRLAQALDESGNILPEAIDKLGLLSGPIINEDISSAAGIDESKLNLDFPTPILQSQISTLNHEIESLVNQIQALAASYSSHISSSGINKHPAIAISVSDEIVESSDLGLSSIPASNLQEALKHIIDSHVGYSGASISSTNNSHTAEQIFFDNTDVAEIVNSANVQSAIEDIANSALGGIRSSLLHLHSNGRIKKGEVVDAFEGESSSTKLLNAAQVVYPPLSGSTKTTFTFSIPQTPLGDISTFDFLRLSNAQNSDDNKDYQISEINYSGSNITSITVFGSLKGEWQTGTSASVYKNKIQNFNIAGLLCSSRPRYNATNKPDVLFVNPNAATLISSAIQPQKISSSDQIELSIDSGAAISLDCYNASFDEQTIDSLVFTLNKQFVEQKLPLIASKVRMQNWDELVISHIISNFSADSKDRTLTLTSAPTHLGFDDLLDVEARGYFGNKFFINGALNSNPINITKLSSSYVELVAGDRKLNLLSGSWFDYGIRVGDLLTIESPIDSSDAGTFRINSISSTQISLDYDALSFAGSLNSTSSVIISSCAVNVGEMTFEEIGGTSGSILFDIFCDSDMIPYYSKRLEVSGFLQSFNFAATPIDISKNFIPLNDEATITVTTDGYAYMEYSLQTGESVFLGTSGVYNIPSPDGLSYVTLLVNKSSNPSIGKTISLYGFNEVKDSNYRIARGLFSTSLGSVLGVTSNPGIPSLIDKRKSGTVDEVNISESFVEKYIEGARNDLRASGVVRGCNVVGFSSSPDYKEFSVNPGVVFCNGIRHEVLSTQNFRVNTATNFYVAINSKGQIQAAPEASLSGVMVSPFLDQPVVHLAYVDNVSSGGRINDLRFFVDRLDLKVGNEIIVSPTGDGAHFASVHAAVFYARNFLKQKTSGVTPRIRLTAGTFQISSQILIDFDVEFSGSGSGTILQRASSFGATSSANQNPAKAIFMIGGSSTTNSDNIENGVTFKDFTYESNIASGKSSLFWLSQDVEYASTRLISKKIFRFLNINLIGPDAMSSSSGIGEYALTIGKASTTSPYTSSAFSCGNVMISNCFFKRAGLEEGCVKVVENSLSGFTTFIATGNTFIEPSPNEMDNVMIFIYPTDTFVYDILEGSNLIQEYIIL